MVDPTTPVAPFAAGPHHGDCGFMALVADTKDRQYDFAFGSCVAEVVERLGVSMSEVDLPSFVSHRSNNAYTNYRCRCDPCREAHAAYRAERRARDPEKYASYMREYMRRYRERMREKQVRG
jgi:hypothetical protein